MAETIRTPVFQRYEVKEKIGSGGMGTVYRARDVNLDRWVALKVLPPGLQDQDEALERFRREARALARLKHPHVAAVYDAHVEHGFPYLVMEFIEGETLEQRLQRRGRLSVAEVVRLGIELADALEHIHSHRIVHRDVKTANVILGPDGRAVLADFGIALVATLPRISHGGMGTPEYMSPEQAEGRDLDGRSDLYSLGVVLYECLTGTVPFQRAGASLADLTALMQHIVATPMPDPREVATEIPDGLVEILTRCTAKRPEDRFPSGRALAEALQALHPAPEAGGPSASEAGVPPTDAARPAARPRPAAGTPAPATAPARLSIISHPQPVVAVRFSPDGHRLATAGADRVVRLWDVPTGRLLHAIEVPDENVLSIAFSPDGLTLATGDAGGHVHLWDARTGARRNTLKGHPALVMSVAYAPDGHTLISGGADGVVRLWDARTGSLVRSLLSHRGYIMAVACAADGHRLASAGADGILHLWDPVTGELLHTREAHRTWTVALAFSPDGQLLASAGADGLLRLWEPTTGELRRTLDGTSAWIMDVAFSPDGRHLAAAGQDHRVRVWDAATGRLVQTLDSHTAPVMTVAYSPDGRCLASGSKDGTVRLWPSRPARRSHTPRLRRTLTWAAAAAVVALLVWNEVPRSPGPQQAGLTPTAATEPATPAPARSRTAASPPPAPADATRPPSVEATLAPALQAALYGPAPLNLDADGWTLIVASRADRREAEQIAAALRAEGFRSGIVPGRAEGQPRYRVAVGHFARQPDAMQARQRLAGHRLPHATWVLRLRPTAR